jgi:hypothetical protein
LIQTRKMRRAETESCFLFLGLRMDGMAI